MLNVGFIVIKKPVCVMKVFIFTIFKLILI